MLSTVVLLNRMKVSTIPFKVSMTLDVQLGNNLQTPVLYAQSNRLSCSVQCEESSMSTFSSGNLLITAGNQLSFDKQMCPLISSASMASANFIWTQKVDLALIVMASVGLVFLVLTETAVMVLYKNVELTVFERGMLATCRVLTPVCLLAVVLGACFWRQQSMPVMTKLFVPDLLCHEWWHP